MSAYFVALVTIHDREKYALYERSFVAVLRQFQGELLSVDDAARTLEGTWPCARTVLLRFADEAALRRWYDSREYQEIARHRFASSIANIAVISGRPT